MSLGFKPTIKSINIASEDLTKITLEIKNDSLKGKFDDLQKLANKTVQVIVVPESYSYVQQFDSSTKKPVQEYIVNPDGTAELKVTEQTQLDVDGKGNIDIYEVTKKVDKDLIDEYIMKSTSLEFPGSINPRDAITRLNKGEDLGEIADSYEMSDAALLGEIEKARQHFAPFADSWDKVRDEVVFQQPDPEKVDEAAETTDNETETVSSETESDDLETGTSDADQNSSSNDEETPGVDVEADGDLLGQSDPYGNEPPENQDSESEDQTDGEDPEDDPYK